MQTFSTAITGSEEPEDATSPRAALINFYRAFNQRDMPLMQDNWLANSEASMSNPLGGVKRGWSEIQSVYKHIFNGEATVYVEYYDFTIHSEPSMFCAVGRERGYFRLADREIALAIRTSRIYRQVGQQWKQLHHHGSMDDPTLLQSYQAAVLAPRSAK